MNGEKVKKEKPGLGDIDLYFITDSTLTKKSIIEDANSAIRAGVKVIQYREKKKSTRIMFEEALTIKELCRKNKVLFIVNDRVDIALAVDADGIHIGDEDMPYEVARRILGYNKIIGLTVHDVGEAIQAEKMGVDYVGLSPIFETKTKHDAGKPSGIKFIEEARLKIKIPFVAIGGINESNIKSVLKAGAKSVAIISAIIERDDVEKECKKFREIILGYHSKNN